MLSGGDFLSAAAPGECRGCLRRRRTSQLKVSLAKLGVLAAIAMAFVLFATMRSGLDTPVAEADLGSPGGITALPSAAPGFPGIANQGIPAIIPASEPGRGPANRAVVGVFCDNAGILPL